MVSVCKVVIYNKLTVVTFFCVVIRDKEKGKKAPGCYVIATLPGEKDTKNK